MSVGNTLDKELKDHIDQEEHLKGDVYPIDFFILVLMQSESCDICVSVRRNQAEECDH